ncbi:helix-turn-helix transcriptional regulator [Streptomyces sp. FXY-T5]|nr:helix-turn-helix transcriptional regulator [Streptomyces sp. FXY-T5]WMD04965.1 helix-turn-helix transcriptional regulator [Streptomyces sp. FXY-T5]
MSAQDDVDDVAEFAALLRTLKERTDRSYGSLARRLAMNTSTLHRYCAGEAVPLDLAPVERFAALCGASPEERLELHRRWLLAVAARQRPRTANTADTADTANTASTASAAGTAQEGAVAAEADETEHAPDVADGSAEGPAEEPPLPRPPWYRRRRGAVGLAAACVVLAALGSLAALPDGRRTPAGDRAGSAGPAPPP